MSNESKIGLFENLSYFDDPWVRGLTFYRETVVGLCSLAKKIQNYSSTIEPLGGLAERLKRRGQTTALKNYKVYPPKHFKATKS